MTPAREPADDAAKLAEEIATIAGANSWTVAVAESLTSGRIASQLGAAPNASSWFAGGVVAYASEVKFKVLDVDRGPVVTARCARQLARGVARLMDADFAVAATGVGGPEPEEGNPAGTVFLAVSSASGEEAEHYQFDGEPAEVVERTSATALQNLLVLMRKHAH
ncbi:CinA family protein [Kribbella jejuensis]|uniref:Nicotinamide-nucleotide amidase n=1 Tax=Kribbella jejuensis TaxID=236068 RepID=A0A542DSU3_9ACTN|nr:CinA family protein [Kribbella jejuensis]TQJ06163.1 nicotinamide-nucleotide amidase [Kribbella jejuensis]